jgi:hypothetical protein
MTTNESVEVGQAYTDASPQKQVSHWTSQRALFTRWIPQRTTFIRKGPTESGLNMWKDVQLCSAPYCFYIEGYLQQTFQVMPKSLRLQQFSGRQHNVELQLRSLSTRRSNCPYAGLVNNSIASGTASIGLGASIVLHSTLGFGNKHI